MKRTYRSTPSPEYARRAENAIKSVVDLPDIPDVVDANSPDIIRVQGRLYYKSTKEGVTNLSNTSWLFNERLINTITQTFSIEYTMSSWSPSDDKYITQTYDDLRIVSGTTNLSGHVKGAPEYAVNTISFTETGYNRDINFVGGTDVENVDLITFLQENATLLEGAKIQFFYKELGTDEELVESIPTDVNIVKDQGEWQLQLEHDSNVLSITSMNEFVNNMTRVDVSNILQTIEATANYQDDELVYEDHSTVITPETYSKIKIIRLTLAANTPVSKRIYVNNLFDDGYRLTNEQIIPYTYDNSAGSQLEIDNVVINVLVANPSSYSGYPVVNISTSKLISSATSTLNLPTADIRIELLG